MKTRSFLIRQIIIGVLVVGINAFRFTNIDLFADESVKEDSNSSLPNCTKAAVEEFPGDFFDQQQRIRGGFIVHFIISIYLIFCLELVCDGYFVPSLEIICDGLNISPDVAGATFMAAGTSSPEFFTNIIGTFVTESDLGIGTIVGSAVFNIFGIIAVCGLFAGKVVPLDWYPITRDCIVYGLSIVILIVVLIDEQVYWYESLVMICASFAYTVLMYYNTSIERWAQSAKRKLLRRNKLEMIDQELNNSQIQQEAVSVISISGEVLSGIQNESDKASVSSSDEIKLKPWVFPKSQSLLQKFKWSIFLPVNLMLFFTVPTTKFLLPVCFVMCMAWIGVMTYVLAWMITLIGYTFGIPDSVVGLTFLAIGTSMPEVFSSLIVSRKGEGSMAVTNCIGSNTFDILICLGLPWTVKSIMSGISDDIWHIEVKSDGLAYTVISLLASLVILYIILQVGKFKLNKVLGWTSLTVYIIFLVFSTLMETNVFFVVNLPSCPSDV